MPDSSSSSSSASTAGSGIYESLGDYTPGGRHPISVGDYLIDDRYRIMHRLGSGSFSTVWLANDASSTSHRFVAAKILTADASARVCEASLRRAGEKAGGGFVVEVLDSFRITGPNGVHLCVVTELLGPTVLAVVNAEAYDGLTPKLGIALRKRLIWECINGVKELHSRGVVHGDLHMGNLGLTFPAHIQSMSIWELWEALGAPVGQRIKPSPSNPRSHPGCLIEQIRLDAAWALCTSASHTPSLRIFDFTESFLSSAPPTTLPGTPCCLAAPELLLEPHLPAWRDRIGPGIDVWAWGCFAFRMFGGIERYPFFAWCNTRQEQLADIMFVRRETVGVETWAEYTASEVGRGWWQVDVAGGWERSKGAYPGAHWEEKDTWEGRVELLERKRGKEEVEVMRGLLERAFVVEPEGRASAEELGVMLEEVWGDGVGEGVVVGEKDGEELGVGFDWGIYAEMKKLDAMLETDVMGGEGAVGVGDGGEIGVGVGVAVGAGEN